jgi:hypothetical protein
MTTILSPLTKQRFVDGSGNALYLGQVTTYAAGTTTPIQTWKDSTGITPNTNPIILNSRGECDIWVLPNVAYKVALADQFGNNIPGWPIDNIVNSQLITLYAGVDTGSANAYVVNFTANFTAYTDGIVLYFIPSNANTGASTINVNGLGIISIINQNGTSLTANELLANQVVTILYKGGSFLLIQGAQQGLVAWGGTDTGAVNAYVVPLTNQYFSYTAGNVLFFIPSNTNTAASTINVKGLGAKSILRPGGGALIGGQILAGALTELVYDGTFFQLIYPNFAVGSFSCALSGGTTTPSVTFHYSLTGNVVTLSWAGVNFTSNSISFGLTGWPNGLQGVNNSVTSPLLAATDNTVTGIACYMTIPNQVGGSNVVLSINNASGNWTNVGTKGLGSGSFSYVLS